MEFDILKKIIGEVLGTDTKSITPETNFVEDLGADSLDIFQIIIGIEEELDVEINIEDTEGIATVGAAVEIMKNAMGN